HCTISDSAPWQINHLFWRRRLVVSPSAFEEPSDAPVRPRRQQRHLRQFDFDGPGADQKRRAAAARDSQTKKLREAGAHDRRRHYGGFTCGDSLLWKPRCDDDKPAVVDGADFNFGKAARIVETYPVDCNSYRG